MSYITLGMILNIRWAKTLIYCLRTLPTKIYKLQHVATHNLVKIICQYLSRLLKIRENKPKSKFRIWPWPLTLTLFSFFWTKELKSKDPRPISLMVYQLETHITYIKCIRGNNSHMESPDYFSPNEYPNPEEVTSNLVK